MAAVRTTVISRKDRPLSAMIVWGSPLRLSLATLYRPDRVINALAVAGLGPDRPAGIPYTVLTVGTSLRPSAYIMKKPLAHDPETAL